MKKIPLVIILILAAYWLMAQSKISPGLWDQISNAEKQGTTIEALIFLGNRYDTKTLDKELTIQRVNPHERAIMVINALQQHARQSQASLVEIIKSKSADKVIHFKRFWVTNVIYIETLPDVILELADHSDVEIIEANEQVNLIRPVASIRLSDRTPGMAEPGLKVINAHKLWEQGITGEGVLLANLDTGVEGDHPALANSWHGNNVPTEQAWHDASSGTIFPTDEDGHGTHTMGTMIGLDENTSDTIGVAFGAEWIAARVNWQTSNILESYEWLLNPDGNSQTSDDMPAVINNSWGSESQCSATFLEAITNLEAAGIAIVFAAGNLGPNPETITSPADLNATDLQVFSVGAIYADNPELPVASFSNRGPSNCTTGTGDSIKPEVVAPGVMVRSSVIGSTYIYWSGTSMATPHVAGAIALLKQAFPEKTGHELKKMLYENAQDLGTPGPDNNYGKGLINVYQAYLANRYPQNPKPPANVFSYSDFNTPSSVEITWTDPEELVGGSALNNFEIDVWRNNELIASVSSDIEMYVDNGLNDGQQYEYFLCTHDLDSDSTSLLVDSKVYCGGSPTPAPPYGVAVTYENETGNTLTWSDPLFQSDGTPIDDLEKIEIFRNGEWVADIEEGVENYIDNSLLNINTTYFYKLRAIDNETPQNVSDYTDKCACFAGINPKILIWVGDYVQEPCIASGDSIFKAIAQYEPSVYLTRNLYDLGEDLDVYDAIFMVLGVLPYNHRLRDNGIFMDLLFYLTGGGNLYLEGGDCFNTDPNYDSKNVKSWFGLEEGPYGEDDVFWITGINDLEEIPTLQNLGVNIRMDELQPVSSTPILQNNDNGEILGVWYDGFGSNGAKTIGMVPSFGGLVDTSGNGNKEFLMYKFLEYFDIVVGEEEKELQVTGCRLQVFPNPSLGVARLRFTVDSKRLTVIDMFSIDGIRIRRLLNEEKEAGKHEIRVDMGNLPAGIYFCTLQTAENMETINIVHF